MYEIAKAITDRALSHDPLTRLEGYRMWQQCPEVRLDEETVEILDRIHFEQGGTH